MSTNPTDPDAVARERAAILMWIGLVSKSIREKPYWWRFISGLECAAMALDKVADTIRQGEHVPIREHLERGS